MDCRIGDASPPWLSCREASALFLCMRKELITRGLVFNIICGIQRGSRSAAAAWFRIVVLGKAASVSFIGISASSLGLRIDREVGDVWRYPPRWLLSSPDRGPSTSDLPPGDDQAVGDRKKREGPADEPRKPYARPLTLYSGGFVTW